jgi:16S rRNA (adenine1518-N6/adenine1519-N6)-dimethyltransferase
MLTSPAKVRALLRELDFRPSKVLGQNFLIDRHILELIVDRAELRPSDAVLEVGPGLGVLTETLAERAGRVVAVEKDRRLYAYLAERFHESTLVCLVGADIMDLGLQDLVSTGLNKVVSNLPYSVGTRVLVELAELDDPPERMVVTLQLDVADRLAAVPGTKAYGAVTVMAQSRYTVTREKIVTPTCFFPAPDVRSAVVRLDLKTPAPDHPSDRLFFRKLLKHAFQFRRKQMGSILRDAPAWLRDAADATVLDQLGLDPRTRPDAVSVETWCALSDALARPVVV